MTVFRKRPFFILYKKVQVKLADIDFSMSAKVGYVPGRHSNRSVRLENIGDEYHYLFECKNLSEERKSLIPVKYTINHNVIKFDSLLNSRSTQELIRLCKFIKVVFSRL